MKKRRKIGVEDIRRVAAPVTTKQLADVRGGAITIKQTTTTDDIGDARD